MLRWSHDHRFGPMLWMLGLMGVLSLFPLAPSVAAQATQAGIVGVVTDTSGAVLPGVTVTATGPALQVPQVEAVTNERGEYRLSPLPIGSLHGDLRACRDSKGFVARTSGCRLDLPPHWTRCSVWGPCRKL